MPPITAGTSILPVSEPGSLDFSAKMLYTHMEGDSDINSSGGLMQIGDTDSVRSQLGVKYEHRISDNFNAFARAVWDYEFDGKTTGSYNHYKISKTDPSGSSGIGEIGLKWQVSHAVTIDLSAHGLIGQRKGYGGNLGLKVNF